MREEHVTYTSSLPLPVMNELSDYADKHHAKKEEVISEAIASFLKEKRKEEYARVFESLRNDPEQFELAEAGIGDFKKMIDDHEKD